MFRVTRYPMISKTESGWVGYRKKYRVAGRVRVPAGHWENPECPLATFEKFSKSTRPSFHLIKVAECQPFYIYFLGFPLSILFMMPCFQKHSLANSDLYSAKCSLSSLPAKIILSNITVKRSTFLTDHAFEGSIFKPET